MKKFLIGLFAITFTINAQSANWEIATVNNGDVYTLNTQKIQKVKTSLPDTEEVISSWFKITYSDTSDGIPSTIEEYYIKCKSGKYLENSYYAYDFDGQIVNKDVNKIPQVDLTPFKPIVPGSVGEVIFTMACNSYYNR